MSTAPVPPLGSPIEVTTVSQWNAILRSAHAASLTCIVDFHAQWCQPCKVIAPFFARLASENPYTYFLRIDVDGGETQKVAAKYQISSMPTFICIKKEGEGKEKGDVVHTMSGADPRGLTDMVKRFASHAYAPSSLLASESAEKEKERGNDFFKNKQYKDAVDAYSRAIEHSSNSGTLYANRALSYLKLIPTLSSKDDRNKTRPKALQDAIKVTELEERWGKGWVRMAEAMLESFCEESLEEMPEDKRKEGRRHGLEGAIEALEDAVGLSEGKILSEAQKMLEDVKKRLSELPL